MRLQVNPTRIELNKCKTRLKAAIKGHKLLKDKSDEMIRQFLELARDAKKLRIQITPILKNTIKDFILIKALSNPYELESVLLTPLLPVKITTAQKSIMGISVPIISVDNKEENLGINSDIPNLDEAAQNMHSLSPALFDLAEKEKACALLSQEIEKTRRRVNALEYIMIPQLNETISYIQMKLDENERSALARLMQVKDALENQG